MPASGVRTTFIYRLGDLAITDTFTYVSPVELTEVVNHAKELMKQRLACSGYGVVPRAIRLSKENVFRDSKVISANDLFGDAPPLGQLVSAGAETTSNAADQPKSAMLVRLDAGDLHRRQWYFAGVPDAVISTFPLGGPVQNQPTWAVQWNLLKNLLVTRPWGFVVQRQPSDGVVRVPVLSVSQQLGTGLLGVATAGPAAFALGATVQLRSFRRRNVAYASANGKWRVAAILTDSPAAGQVTYFLLASAGVVAQTIVAPGTIEAVDYATLKISDVTLQEATTRKRGNRRLAGPGARRRRVPLPI